MARMRLPEDPEDPLIEVHHQVVKEFNLDDETAAQVWNNYLTIRSSYSLEGEAIHWLGCAVFVASRKSLTPTVSKSVVKGNPVSLTSLLRFCKLSLQEFFNKITKWSDMANLHDDDDFQAKIKKLGQNFAVTCNIHKEYYPMFIKPFKVPEVESNKHRNRKLRAPCIRIFEFTWLLFITIKGRHQPSCGSDILTSYYLLLACLDLMFKNAFLGNRRDLLNPSFSGLPLNWSMAGYQVPEEAPCIIEKLCNDKQLLTNALYAKEYTLKTYLTELFSENILQGNKENFTGLLDPRNFETNYTNITKCYEQQILNDGDFDEKIFLAEYQRQFKIKNVNGTNNSNSILPSEIGENGISEVLRIDSTGPIIQQCPDTPLTGRKYVGPRDANDASLLSTATHGLSVLQGMLEGCSTEPSDSLIEIFKECPQDPTEQIKEVLDKLGTKFLEKMPSSNEQDRNKLDLSIALFYKLLENILKNEKSIKKDIGPLLQKSIFYECLFPCCIEIVVHSYNLPIKFPWILEVLEVPPSYFVRVIELIVRLKDPLSRYTIKHLSFVEESILESLMWKSNSVLWEDIKKWGEDVPKFDEISLPDVMESNLSDINSNSNKKNLPASILQSPGPSAVETFQSPINSQIKKQLFQAIKPGQSLLQQSNRPTHFIVTDQDGVRKVIPIESSQIIPTSPLKTVEKRPKKTGSLCIILRKFYILAWVRMDHLCSKLGITEIEFKRKIWTVFEHSVRKTKLLMDRHLDQLLMCAVYVNCKMSNKQINFQDIMKCYRAQPQSASHIYRNVLISNSDRSHLIDFYNVIYVPNIKDFIRNFSGNVADLLLSPLPGNSIASPRHQVMKNVFILPYESPGSENNLHGNSRSYYFSRSASKDLKDINNAINGNCPTRKRLLTDSSSDTIPNKRVNRKVQALLEERKGQSVDE